jgi:SAM-dependent methyltransferase
VEGLALLRHLYDGSDVDAEQRLAEVKRILNDDTFAASEDITEAESRTGYAAWSDRYDEPGNPLIAIEEPAVWSLIDRLSPGRALDAACGTGRHARHLSSLGHRVVGVDNAPEMMQRARAQLADAQWVEGDLRAVPLAGGGFDLVVSGLALAHLPDLGPPISELARVLRPGGRLVISVLHPFQAYLGWHAPFEDASGQRGFVREYPHTHADYLAAFRRAGLSVVNCLEPALTKTDVRSKRRAFRNIPEATLAAYEGMPAALIWEAQKWPNSGG